MKGKDSFTTIICVCVYIYCYPLCMFICGSLSFFYFLNFLWFILRFLVLFLNNEISLTSTNTYSVLLASCTKQKKKHKAKEKEMREFFPSKNHPYEKRTKETKTKTTGFGSVFYISVFLFSLVLCTAHSTVSW